MKKDNSYLINIIEYAKLPPSKITIETFQGIIIYTILDTKIFPRNKDIAVFLKDIFDIQFREYVYASRTLVLARVVREINKLKKDEVHTLKVSFFEYFKDRADINIKGDLSKWLQG